MNSLACALVEKTGHDNGFEYVLEQMADALTLASARHKAHVAMPRIMTETEF